MMPTDGRAGLACAGVFRQRTRFRLEWRRNVALKVQNPETLAGSEDLFLTFASERLTPRIIVDLTRWIMKNR